MAETSGALTTLSPIKEVWRHLLTCKHAFCCVRKHACLVVCVCLRSFPACLTENVGLPQRQEGRGLLPEPGGTDAVMQVIEPRRPQCDPRDPPEYSVTLKETPISQNFICVALFIRQRICKTKRFT